MAAAGTEKARGSRLFLLIALVGLAVVSAAGFTRVFQGRDTALKLILAAAAATLLAGALERRHVLIAAVASAAGLAVTLGLMVFPGTTKYLLPTPTTWRAAVQALHAVGHTAQVQVAPALPLAPLMLAAITAVWTAAFAAHSLSARARSPFLAILPLAALLAFAGTLLEDGAQLIYTIPFLAAALAMLFADGFRRVGHWGPVTVWHGRSKFGVGSVSTTRTARRVAAACLGVAWLFPWVLPGFTSNGILNINGGQNSKFVSIDPIVDIRPALLNTRPVELFTVRSPRAAYWRFLSLDTFDGRLWKSSNLEASRGADIGIGQLRPNTGELPGSGDVSQQLHQTFRFDRLIQPWLPAAFNPVFVAIRGGAARYDPEGDVLVAPNGTYRGFSYDVDSELVVPAPADLDNQPLPTGPSVARYTALPPDTPKQISDIAHHLADGAPDTYRKVLAVQDYLHGFRYDQRVPPGHSTSDILRFLLQTKAGYCEQFAGSMAVLLRSLGIPARVAVGFTPGTYDAAAGVYRVSSQNAHAWVEVLFPRYGWLAFEPTPTRTNPVGSQYISPAAGLNGTSVAGCSDPDPKRCGIDTRTKIGPGRTGLGPGPAGTRKRIGHDEGVAPGGERTGPSINFAPPEPEPNPWRTRALEAALLLLVLVGLAIPVAKSVARRLTVARAHDPRQRVLAAYEVMNQRASDVGLGRRPHETLAEYRDRVTTRVPTLDGPLDLLTGLAARAAYSEDGVGSEQADEAIVSARQAARAIRGAASLLIRLGGMFRLERYALPR